MGMKLAMLLTLAAASEACPCPGSIGWTGTLDSDAGTGWAFVASFLYSEEEGSQPFSLVLLTQLQKHL